MSDKVKTLAPAIWDEIQKANNILLHCHPSADPDSVGSALGMMHLLKSIGKNVTVITGDNPIPRGTSTLPGASDILSKNYFEIDAAKFDLFIALDSSTKGQISRKGEVTFPKTMRTIKIDHHENNADFADVNLQDISYPAVCQILYDLFNLWKVKITPDCAACLITGIYTDSGGFKYPPTNWETLLAASELAKIYPDYFRIIFSIENSVTPKQLEFLGLALNSIEHYFGNKVAISAVPFIELKKRSIEKFDTRDVELPNILKSVPGWIIGISFVEFTPNNIEISFRKREFEGPDLSIIAIALGGGGHKSASGASISKSFDEAKHTLLDTLQNSYPEFGNP